MLLDYDFMGQSGNGIVFIRAGEKPVPEVFEYRLEIDLASFSYFKPGPVADQIATVRGSRIKPDKNGFDFRALTVKSPVPII